MPLTVLSAYVVACCLDQVPGGLAILIIGLVAGLGNLYISPPHSSALPCAFSEVEFGNDADFTKTGFGECKIGN